MGRLLRLMSICISAYYKCKTDGCNNIEPITTEVTEVIRASPILLSLNVTVAPAAATGSPVVR